MERSNGKKIDYIFLATVSILVCLGILILAGIATPLSHRKFEEPHYFLKHQLFYGLLPGLILGFIAFFLPLNYFKKFSAVFLLLALVFMAMVFLPGLGVNSGGATRWLKLGSFSFQPSEALKPAFFLYLASWLSSRSKSRKTKSFNENFLGFLFIIGLISLFLIKQPDISTLFIIVMVAIIMYFLAETPFWHTVAVCLILIIGLIGLIYLAPYRMDRFITFLNPNSDPMGKGYQISQSLIAVGSGGIFGRGLGMSGQKYGFLPGSMADSVFAIFSEETGFIGSIFLVSLFICLLWRGLKIAKGSNDLFAKLCAIGISSWIAIQAAINICSMLNLLPLTGIPLPFISYGGSAMIAEMAGVGIVLNISRK